MISVTCPCDFTTAMETNDGDGLMVMIEKLPVPRKFKFKKNIEADFVQQIQSCQQIQRR